MASNYLDRAFPQGLFPQTLTPGLFEYHGFSSYKVNLINYTNKSKELPALNDLNYF